MNRAQLASDFLDQLTEQHSDIMQPIRSAIRLTRGNIVSQLAELFAHSHVLMFDVRFPEPTWRIIAHLLSYIHGVRDQVIVSCQKLDTCNSDLVAGRAVSLQLSEVMGGASSFTGHVNTVDPVLQRRHAVEVFRSSVHA